MLEKDRSRHQIRRQNSRYAAAHRDRLKVEPNERPEAKDGVPTKIGIAQAKRIHLIAQLADKMEANGLNRRQAEAAAVRRAKQGRRRPEPRENRQYFTADI